MQRPTAGVAAGPVAALNSVQKVQRKYSFNPDRYTDNYEGRNDWWSVSSTIPIHVQRLWVKMEAGIESQPLGHFI